MSGLGFKVLWVQGCGLPSLPRARQGQGLIVGLRFLAWGVVLNVQVTG